MSDGWRYPNIHDLCFAIALDNGGVNRFRDATDVHNQIADWIDSQDDNILPVIDDWIGTLTPEQRETAADGEHSEIDAVFSTAPPFARDLFDRYFDEVC